MKTKYIGYIEKIDQYAKDPTEIKYIDTITMCFSCAVKAVTEGICVESYIVENHILTPCEKCE